MKRGITLPDEARNCMFRMQMSPSTSISSGGKPNIMQQDYQSLLAKYDIPITHQD